MSLGAKMLPMASKVETKVIPGLATGVLNSLGSFGINKILGNGQTGGFLIPQDKIDKLIQHKNLLTALQKKKIISSSTW